ncbi:CHAT domain-containing protein [Desulfococcaceae bacterium HSG8]|nr:CHAT domain-containing protein [Desulfococcaceae bacterium HSG8]
MEPALILSQVGGAGNDGFLTMNEVMDLKLGADIAALTACETGRGEHLSGEGVMGMGRAFQYAGAKSVLVSLWSVSEESSVKLTEKFFSHIKDGKDKADALRLARQEIRKRGYDHPFFWAPFVLHGEWR